MNDFPAAPNSPTITGMPLLTYWSVSCWNPESIVHGSTIPSCLRGVCCCNERLPRSPEFAHHHRYALADILVGQLLESRIYVAFFWLGGVASRVTGIMVSRPPEVNHIAPRLIALLYREQRRRVAMIFHHQ